MHDHNDSPPAMPLKAGPSPWSQAEGMRLHAWLRWPAIILLVLSAGSLIVDAVLTAKLGWEAWRDSGASDALLSLTLNGCVVMARGIVLYGAICMLRRRSYRSARGAAILASMPLCSPLYFAGIPFGIWAWFLLGNLDLKGVFDSAAAINNARAEKA